VSVVVSQYWIADSPSPAVMSETITKYAYGGAREYLAELRGAVGRCPSVNRNGTAHRHRIIARGFAGDESLLITRTFLTRYRQDQPFHEATYRMAVVRIGAVVLVLYDHGWENSAISPTYFEQVAAAAVRRLRSWLG
jgi:hypothetical protein